MAMTWRPRRVATSRDAAARLPPSNPTDSATRGQLPPAPLNGTGPPSRAIERRDAVRRVAPDLQGRTGQGEGRRRGVEGTARTSKRFRCITRHWSRTRWGTAEVSSLIPNKSCRSGQPSPAPRLRPLKAPTETARARGQLFADVDSAVTGLPVPAPRCRDLSRLGRGLPNLARSTRRDPRTSVANVAPLQPSTHVLLNFVLWTTGAARRLPRGWTRPPRRPSRCAPVRSRVRSSSPCRSVTFATTHLTDPKEIG